MEDESQGQFRAKCPNCGHTVEEGDKFCPNCGQPFDERLTPEPPPTPPIPPSPPDSGQSGPGAPGPDAGNIPWENKEKIGFFEALWQTWQESVFNPERFFSKLPARGGFGNPLLYAILVSWIGIIIYMAYSLLMSGFWEGMFGRYLEASEHFLRFSLRSGFYIMFMIFAPIGITIGLFIASGIYHLIFIIMGWAKRDFEATFRAMAYSYGPMIFLVVPFCGSIVAGIWSVVLIIIGFKHMQQTTGGKAAFVYFLPLILCCCFAFAAIIVIMLIFGAAFFSTFGDIFRHNYGQ